MFISFYIFSYLTYFNALQAMVIAMEGYTWKMLRAIRMVSQLFVPSFCLRAFRNSTHFCLVQGKDCSLFLSRYPNCKVDEPELVGNGQCDGSSYYSPSCGWDGGDCSQCNIADLGNVIGNGICEGNALSNECGWDGGVREHDLFFHSLSFLIFPNIICLHTP